MGIKFSFYRKKRSLEGDGVDGCFYATDLHTENLKKRITDRDYKMGRS